MEKLPSIDSPKDLSSAIKESTLLGAGGGHQERKSEFVKKLLLTIATPEIRTKAEPFLQNHKAYAEAQGYDYSAIPIPHWSHLHPSFSKVAAIAHALEYGYEYIIFADCDVAFMDHNRDLSDLVSGNEGYFMAAYHQKNWPKWTYLCAGFTIWKNTPEAKRFVIDNWFQRVDKGYITDHPWEQWTFDELIRECNYRGLRACSAHEIGCFCPEIWHDGVIWQKGMPTIHMAGQQASWERRAEIYETIYKRQVQWKK